MLPAGCGSAVKFPVSSEGVCQCLLGHRDLSKPRRSRPKSEEVSYVQSAHLEAQDSPSLPGPSLGWCGTCGSEPGTEGLREHEGFPIEISSRKQLQEPTSGHKDSHKVNRKAGLLCSH